MNKKQPYITNFNRKLFDLSKVACINISAIPVHSQSISIVRIEMEKRIEYIQKLNSSEPEREEIIDEIEFEFRKREDAEKCYEDLEKLWCNYSRELK